MLSQHSWKKWLVAGATLVSLYAWAPSSSALAQRGDRGDRGREGGRESRGESRSRSFGESRGDQGRGRSNESRRSINRDNDNRGTIQGRGDRSESQRRFYRGNDGNQNDANRRFDGNRVEGNRDNRFDGNRDNRRNDARRDGDGRRDNDERNRYGWLGRDFDRNRDDGRTARRDRDDDRRGNWGRDWDRDWDRDRGWNGDWGRRDNWRRDRFFAFFPFFSAYPGWNTYGYGYNYPFGYVFPYQGYYPYDGYTMFNNGLTYSDRAYRSDDVVIAALPTLDEAKIAFRDGNYDETLRLAQQAGTDNPQDPRVSEMISLALFAKGEFRASAGAAQGVLFYGQAADWPTLFSYYGDGGRYTEQLNRLKAFVQDNPNVAEGHFLLGYHRLMMGHVAAARDSFAMTLQLQPEDRIAQRMVDQLDSVSGRTAAAQPDVPATTEPGQPLDAPPVPDDALPEGTVPQN